MRKLIVTNFLAFAEFERTMIIERTQQGKAIAKQKSGFIEVNLGSLIKDYRLGTFYDNC